MASAAPSPAGLGGGPGGIRQPHRPGPAYYPASPSNGNIPAGRMSNIPQAHMGVSPQPSGPPGSLQPGTLVKVGPYTVTVKRYLSQGGFATVYLCNTDRPVAIPSSDGSTRNETTHVLKRIVVPDKDTLAEVKREVEVHRMLRHDPSVVFFLEASALSLPPPQQGYEVYILMEYCNGGGLLDLLNARLRNRLTEIEVFTIFADICKGVAAMHHLDPPIAHRDLKIENILLSKTGSQKTVYKLCDFGSAKPILSRRPPRSMDELKRLELDLNKSTTLPYRPPEMVDVYQRRVIDEKADIWALGVLLYKLCYYTTPFEENGGGPLAILNVKYRFPSSPPYSNRVKGLVASLLTDPSTRRPSIDDLLVNVHKLMGVQPPKSALHYSQLAQAGKQMTALPRPVDQPSMPTSNGKSAPSAVDDDILIKIASSSRDKKLQSARPLSVAHPSVQSSASHSDLISFQSNKAPAPNAAAESKRIMELEGVTPMRRGRPATGASSSSRNASPSKQQSSLGGSSVGKLDLSKFESRAAAKEPAAPTLPSKEDNKSAPSAPPSGPRVGTLVEGFGDSFEPEPEPPVAGTTNQGALSVPAAASQKHSPVLPTSESASAARTPVTHSPALPGLGAGTPPTMASAPATQLPESAAAGDESAEGRFPSLAELDKRYPQPTSSSSTRDSEAPARKSIATSWKSSTSSSSDLTRSSSTTAAPSTSLSQSRYDEARKTMGKRESMANIAGRFGGMNVGAGGTGISSPLPPLPNKAKAFASETNGPAPRKGSSSQDRPTPSLPPRKPVPNDWLSPSASSSSSARPALAVNGSEATQNERQYKSPARYGSKPSSPAVEAEDVLAAKEHDSTAAAQEIDAADDRSSSEDEGAEGPEDVDGGRFGGSGAADIRRRWTLRQDPASNEKNKSKDADYPAERPSAPVSVGEKPGKLKAPAWLEKEQPPQEKPAQESVPSPVRETTTAQARAPAWDWDAEDEADRKEMRALQEPGVGRITPEKLVDVDDVPEDKAAHVAPDRHVDHLQDRSSDTLAPEPPSKQFSSSSADSATKGLPSRQRRAMGKEYADAATSPAVMSPSSSIDEPAQTPLGASEAKKYAPGTAQSMASRWESMGPSGAGAQRTSGLTRSATVLSSEVAAATTVLSPPPKNTPSRAAGPPQVPTKPASLKPWEREAAERAEVEKFGYVRSNRGEDGTPPALSTASTGNAAGATSGAGDSGSGAGDTMSQQQRYQSVASLIEKWQSVKAPSGRTPSGWGEIGGGGGGGGEERLPGRDI